MTIGPRQQIACFFILMQPGAIGKEPAVLSFHETISINDQRTGQTNPVRWR